jgi:predicted dehydrogenase
MATGELLADPEIEMVLNLTVPLVHKEVNCQVLNAGKHVYCEKPLAVNLKDGKDTIALAKEKGLRVGCAPDTFLGGGIQTCRKLIDDGAIGQPVSAMAFMVCHGHESWHPDPEFYYQQGGGPMLDMGPYYLTALVNLLGPIKRISGSAGMAMKERTITSEKKYGKKVPVETPTHLTGAMDFTGGAIATVVMSFDVWKASVPRIEVHGTEGSLSVPDPNTFGGPVRLFKPGDKDWQEIEIKDFAYCGNSRGIGITDMAIAEQESRAHRVSGDLACHVLEAMLSFEQASVQGAVMNLETTCERPEALSTGLKDGEVK